MKPTTLFPVELAPDARDVGSGGIVPTAVQPTAVQPTVVQPTVVQPTVVQPTVVQPTAAGPTVARPARREQAPGTQARSGHVAVLPARTALSRPEGPDAAWSDWSADPYVGCEFGCRCGSAPRARPRRDRDDVRDHVSRVRVKRSFADSLRRDLRTRVRPGEHVAFGTVTDPYPPEEAHEGVMRSALRELSNAASLQVSITTRSPLITRDVDLLRAVAERNAVHVNVAIPTPDPRLAQFLEPGAPAPSSRLETLRTLRQAGLRAGVFLVPVLPGVTDGDADLRSLVAAVSQAGALHVAHRVVVVEGPARARLLASLRRAYPRVAARYEVWIRTARNTSPGVPPNAVETNAVETNVVQTNVVHANVVHANVARRVRALVRAYGIPGLPPAATAGRGSGDPRCPGPESQRTFAFAAPTERVA